MPIVPIVSFTPDENGLGVQPSGLRIDFGRSPEGVISALNQGDQALRILDLRSCPANIRQRIQWGDLVLTFTDEQFVGWRTGDTRKGVTCSS